MGTPAAIQHARIVAFSPPTVKDGQVALRVMLVGLDVVELSFDHVLGREIAAAIKALFPEPQPPARRPNHQLPPDQVAVYRRVVAAVNAGATWDAAAQAEGVKGVNVKSWWAGQKKLAAARAPGAPVTKPSGALL